jgi:hypothetical protein
MLNSNSGQGEGWIPSEGAEGSTPAWSSPNGSKQSGADKDGGRGKEEKVAVYTSMPVSASIQEHI